MEWYDQLGGLFQSGIEAYGTEQAREQLEQTGQQANVGAQALGQTAYQQSQFQPFAITSGTGGIGTTATGGTNLNLSPQQQQLQESLFGAQGQLAGQIGQQQDPRFNQLQAMGLGGALQQFGGIAGAGSQFAPQQQNLLGLANLEGMNFLQGTGARESDIYDRIRAMQSPEEERQRLQLEQRLQAQGRGGVRTAQFGGTPEQLAMAKAQAEAQNQASFGAMSQAQQERQQQFQNMMGAQQGAGQLAGLQQQLQQGQLGLTGGMFGLGQQAGMAPQQQQAAQLQNLQGLLGAGFAGENQLLNQLQASTNIASIADLGRRTGAEQQVEAGMGGLEAMLTAQQGSAELGQQYFNTLAGLFGQQQGGQQGLLGQIFGGSGAGLTEAILGSASGTTGGTTGVEAYDSLMDLIAQTQTPTGGVG